MTKRAWSLGGIVMTCCVWGCSGLTGAGSTAAQSADENGGTPKYAFWSDVDIKNKSILLLLEKSRALTVCYAGEKDKKALQTIVASAVQSWIGLLNQPAPKSQGYPAWSIPASAISVRFACDKPDVTVVLEQQVRAYATLEPKREVHLDSKDLEYRVIAHEFGHLMGLGDTYSENGKFAPIMQPPSIMQNAASFSEDDRAGIWNIWRYLKSGGSPCGPGYREGQTSIAGSGETYCVPEGTSTCDKPCLSYNLVDGQCDTFLGSHWKCEQNCLKKVSSCGACEPCLAGLQENVCMGGLICRGGCALYLATCGEFDSKVIPCSQYKVDHGRTVKLKDGLYTCKGSTLFKNDTTSSASEPPESSDMATTSASNSDCQDANVSCAPWAQSGECQNNPNYMLTQCCRSCESLQPAPGAGGAVSEGSLRDGTCYPYCPNGAVDDPDGDGWGYANDQSCIVASSAQDSGQPC